MFISPLNQEELKKIFSQESLSIIKYFIFKSIFSQPELKKGQNVLPIHIPKEHLEQWMVQSLDVEPVGAGSYPIDIISKDKTWGADVKMLAWDGKVGSKSRETSLKQNFKGPGKDLDLAFTNKSFNSIILGWSKLLEDKYQVVSKDFPKIGNIYYLFFIRQGHSFHLCGMKLNLNTLGLMKEKRNNQSSVWVDNMIEDDLGEVKIYKAKKRMELRLIPFNWKKKNLLISFDETFTLPNKNLLELNLEELKTHSSEVFNKLLEALKS